MDARGLIIIFGSLALCAVAIVVGAAVSAPWGRALLAVGILGALAWVCVALWLMNAMNTDI